MAYRIAVGTSDEVEIDQHFGSSRQFVVYEVSVDGAITRLEARRNETDGVMGQHQEDRLRRTAALIEDCGLVLVSHIGPGAVNLLKHMGIDAQIGEGPVDAALAKLLRFRRRFMGGRQESTEE